MKNYIYFYLLIAATITLSMFYRASLAENIAFLICQLIFIWNSYAFKHDRDMVKFPKMIGVDVSKTGERTHRAFLYWACNLFSILLNGVLIGFNNFGIGG